jgi:glycosyltransferase involved in cell wall biosynthesis
MAFGRIGPSIVSRAVARMYDAVDADIYVLPGNNAMAAELAMFCNKRGKKYVMLAGSDMDFNPEIKTRPRQCDSYGVPGYMMLYALQNAHAFIVQSERQADLLHCHFGKRAIVVHNPIDIKPVFPKFKTPQDILWVGKSDKVKRPDLALDLAATFPGDSFTLVMSLSDQAVYERCFQRAEVLGNIRMFHFVPFNEIERYFAGARLLLNTSVFEGFPNAFLQAAKYGVPIVSLQVDPCGMLSSHGCGFSCGGSVEKMRDAIQGLLADDRLYAEKSANCLRYVREFHDKDKIAVQYEDAFLKILTG